MIVRTIARHERDRALTNGSAAPFQALLRPRSATICVWWRRTRAVRLDLQIIEDGECRRPRISVGGVGNVFTTEAYRGKGVASQALRRALEVMEGGEVRRLAPFASRLISGSSAGAGITAGITTLGATADAGGVLRKRDLAAVIDVCCLFASAQRHGGPRSALLEGQLRYAGSPDETSPSATADRRLRSRRDLYGVITVMEHAPCRVHANCSTCSVSPRSNHASAASSSSTSAPTRADGSADERGFGVNEVEDVF
jgi:GNAT superfamily N-acetyltransferase